MSEAPKTAAEKQEAAAIRRRWITLGEVLAVAAVLISGLTLWNSYQDRNAEAAEKSAEKAEASARAQHIVLRAGVENGGRNLKLSPLDSDQAIQTVSIAFPSALGARGIDAAIDPRIEAGWVENAAKAARKAAKDDAAVGDKRLPIAITTRFVSGGESYTDTALYDLGYKIDSGLLTGTDVELRGLSRIERTNAANASKRLDAIWASRSR